MEMQVVRQEPPCPQQGTPGTCRSSPFAKGLASSERKERPDSVSLCAASSGCSKLRAAKQVRSPGLGGRGLVCRALAQLPALRLQGPFLAWPPVLAASAGLGQSIPTCWWLACRHLLCCGGRKAPTPGALHPPKSLGAVTAGRSLKPRAAGKEAPDTPPASNRPHTSRRCLVPRVSAASTSAAGSAVLWWRKQWWHHDGGTLPMQTLDVAGLCWGCAAAGWAPGGSVSGVLGRTKGWPGCCPGLQAAGSAPLSPCAPCGELQ